MSPNRVGVFAAIFLFTVVSYASNISIQPTTTLSALTGNNTSASNLFTTQTNGNIQPSNISTMDVHSLLYPGANTKIYAHLMLWFGRKDHMNVGYDSTDPAQVHRQITDMISRGIDGVVIVWYGPNNSIDRATKAVMAEAELHPGFTFAIFIDRGAIQWDSCTGCDPQQALLQQLQYLEQTYFSSPAYLRLNGSPVVSNFDVDVAYTIDWNALDAALASHPAFLFQNPPGFTHNVSEGAYAWVRPAYTDYALGYLKNFYGTGQKHAGLSTWGAVYKGFNDSLASWGLNRVMQQQCGNTWLQTFATIDQLYDSTNQLPAMQLVTWNDYEEGTEIESGIDNCVSLTAGVNGSSLQWNVTGDESTIDHYTVYASKDGQNLMPLIDQPTGVHSLNLCSYSWPDGAYTMYVRAVGKPSLTNHISSAVAYAPSCGTSQAGSVTLSASPNSLNLSPGQMGQLNVNVASQGNASNSPISFSCSGLPMGMSCNFSPATLTLSAQGGRSRLTIAAIKPSFSTLASTTTEKRPGPLYGLLMSFPFVAIVFGYRVRTRLFIRSLIVVGILATIVVCSSCSGITASSARASGSNPSSAYTLTINGISAGGQAIATTQVSVIVAPPAR